MKSISAYLLIVMNILLTTTNSNAMPKNLSKTEKQIKALIPQAEKGDKQVLEQIYHLALQDPKISELNSLDQRDSSPFPILLEDQIEIKSKTNKSGISSVDRKEMKVGDYSAIAWILYNLNQEPNTPYVYALAKRMMNIKNVESAQNWYMTAAMMARIDASKCEDKTAPQGILIIESEFSDIKQSLKNQNEFNRALSFALDQEEKFKDRPLPKWICSHGIEALSGELKYKDEATWEKDRMKIRAKQEAKLSETPMQD
jgi:hypothetical protein